ncbi:glycerol-3-phosphate 1-O-acyltransferase PlsY [Peptostreptococcus equinus]|uniref:Glycerol-3-phosphate acyltransferase n=1 Tax=Peptostreptococcus equinus TaxID=3003601 RepID=A0ABY7JTX6_9FIRM|nr:glycerol-3-phosphate 1-O-acyltransferase PlsY [Peptostreptococcus sp. CBA3647]WAW15608.1 glycerol-3-phosphate 1-O-acyltransferase PlsY [Peptostreptococcus sp. CBA3647]
MLIFLLILIISYLFGNIPSSVLVGKYFGIDIRTKGSKNPGATNTLRTLGLKAGLIAFLGDFFKGTVAVLVSIFIAKTLNGDIYMAKYISALAVVCGHNWPFTLNFKGGKGVATTYGALMAISPLVTVTSMIFFIVVVAVTKYVSLGSMLGVTLFVILMAIRGDYGGVWVCTLLTLSVLYKHRQNIKRLINGNESRFSLKKNK